MHIIFKDIDSRGIKGLIIQSLPPITKPQMRVQVTEIDGRDGDIVEELGYKSYEKQIKIGLLPNADIDEVIEYFSGSGKFITSDEPDKYYNATIVNQVDYQRLLMFKEATVKFHIQPYKYLVHEETRQSESENMQGNYFENIQSCSSLAKFKNLQVPLGITNLFNYENLTGGSITKDGLTARLDGEYIEVKGRTTKTTNISFGYTLDIQAGTYTFSTEGKIKGIANMGFKFNSGTDIFVKTNDVSITKNLTDEQIAKVNKFDMYFGANTDVDMRYRVMLNVGSIPYDYVPFGRFYRVTNQGKNLIDDTDLYIGYLNLDGSFTANGSWRTTNYIRVKPNQDYCISYAPKTRYLVSQYSNKGVVVGSRIDSNTTKSNTFRTLENATYIRVSIYDDVNKLEYVQLEKGTTPTEFEKYRTKADFINMPIVESKGFITLYDGLNDIYVSDFTNIEIEYLKPLKVINCGKLKALPLIHLKGDGSTQFKINNRVWFTYNFDDDKEVYIDCLEQNAYLGTKFKNKNMNGDFPILELGMSNIEVTGSITEIEILSRSRWL